MSLQECGGEYGSNETCGSVTVCPLHRRNSEANIMEATSTAATRRRKLAFVAVAILIVACLIFPALRYQWENYELLRLLNAGYGGAIRVRVAQVRDILAAGADVNAGDSYGRTALMWAAEHGDVDCVKFLVARGANVNARDADGSSALSHAVWGDDEYRTGIDCVKFLISTSVSQPVRDQALIAAAASANWSSGTGLDSVKLLVSSGADVNARNSLGWTPIMYACRQDRLDIVKYLLSKGADVTAKTKMGQTILMLSADQAIISILKAAGARG